MAHGVVHLDLGGEYRGGQRQVLYLARAQHLDGMAVQIAAPRGAPLLDQAGQQGLPTLSLPGRFDFDPRNVAALALGLTAGHILHTHDARGASLGALVRLTRPGLTLIHTRRVSYPLGQGWSRWKYRLADMVVCVSQEVREQVVRAGVSRAAVIPSAIVLARYSPRQVGNHGRIGIIGALSPQKGHDQLFRALARLDTVPEVWIVGKGRLEQSLRDLADELGIAGRIEWKGQVESPQILPWLDVLVVPSAHGEGSSGVIKEGWAAGVPVVCSDLPANLELVRHEDNGLVFANGRPDELARQLRRLAGEPELAASVVRGGNLSVQDYDVSCMYQAYQGLYQTLTPC